jgi:hypothetical protein
MTKTIDHVTGLPQDISKNIVKCSIKKNEDPDEDPEASNSPPLVLTCLDSLPPDKEVTLLVEIVERPTIPGPSTRRSTNIRIQKSDQQHEQQNVIVLFQQQEEAKFVFTAPKIIAENPFTIPALHHDVASVVKDEVKEEQNNEEFEEFEEVIEEEEDCMRIIEEREVDVSTLPGKKSRYLRIFNMVLLQ